MTPKRKKPEPPLELGLPRRSTRKAGEAHETRSDGPGGSYWHEVEPYSQKHAMVVEENKGEVAQAIRQLGEMEEKLQSAVKRQRLAVESSELSTQRGPRDDMRLPSEPSRATRDVIDKRPVTRSELIEHGLIEVDDSDENSGDKSGTSANEGQADRGARRPPPINSEILPLPWSGRLGYACLNTYLRTANPPVFSSRTCRLSSILDHRHPLQDPTQPEHPTKNRPDKTKPPDIARGQRFVQELGLANARDIVRMLLWNDKYGIKFMRLSSEMFPFASHAEHGYSLAPFASEVLGQAGTVAAELGHRLTTHPGQYTQIASPRKEVVAAAFRDLEYHDEMLSLLNLPEQLNRDAVMILHMGGTYGDKEATLDRFRENYPRLSDGVKRRLVLENDDVAWSVHDLLPICEELNIPLVLDYHHHNIVFDPSIREGSHDLGLYDRIRATWARKGIRQKMHYSEQTSAAISPHDRRKHSARVRTLPPCANDMDLMIEAKDKEQAVFELMRTFKLPGWDRFNNIVPHERDDEARKAVKKAKVKRPKTKKGVIHGEEMGDFDVQEKIISPEDFGMGGPENRVYWPEGMEEWLKPRKREANKVKMEEE